MTPTCMKRAQDSDHRWSSILGRACENAVAVVVWCKQYR